MENKIWQLIKCNDKIYANKNIGGKNEKTKEIIFFIRDFYSYYDDNGNYGSNEGEDYGFRFGCEDNEEFKVVLPEGQEDEYRNVWKYALLGYMQNTESPNYDDEKANALFNQIIGLNKESEVDERID